MINDTSIYSYSILHISYLFLWSFRIFINTCYFLGNTLDGGALAMKQKQKQKQKQNKTKQKNSLSLPLIVCISVIEMNSTHLEMSISFPRGSSPLFCNSHNSPLFLSINCRIFSLVCWPPSHYVLLTWVNSNRNL